VVSLGHFNTTQKQISIVHLQFLVYRPESSQPKKYMVMLICFANIKGILHYEFVSLKQMKILNSNFGIFQQCFLKTYPRVKQ